MTLTSKEHYEMMDFFERHYKGEFRMDREEKINWAKGAIYQHGDANRMFLAFRHGVAYGVAEARQ